MNRVAVVVPLRIDAHDRVRELVAQGPPFDPGDTPLAEHEVFLTAHEAVFVFAGRNAREAVEALLGDADVWRAATEWRELLADKPRLAELEYTWERPPEPLHFPGL